MSAHFDGKHFQNQRPREEVSFGQVLRWGLRREHTAWPELTGIEPGPKPPERVGDGELRVTFVGHATVLVQLDGVAFLTDPIWSERCSPFSSLGPKRVRPPGIRFEDLPPIDFVVVSHNHYDHMDVPTLKRLAARFPAMEIFVGLGNAAFLRSQGLKGVVELDWWQSVRRGGLEVMAAPAEHFSNRGLCDRNANLWSGFVVKGKGGPVYFAGDTGMGPHFAQLRERVGTLRLALLPIGAYLPRWLMAPVHLSPQEAVEAHLELGAAISMGMHYGTFDLSDETPGQAERELHEAMAQHPNARPFWTLGFGEGRDVPDAR